LITEGEKIKQDVANCIFAGMNFKEEIREIFLEQLYIDLVTQVKIIESEFCVLEITEHGELYFKYKEQPEKPPVVPREKCTVYIL
jgi:hypothetical protein